MVKEWDEEFKIQSSHAASQNITNNTKSTLEQQTRTELRSCVKMWEMSVIKSKNRLILTRNVDHRPIAELHFYIMNLLLNSTKSHTRDDTYSNDLKLWAEISDTHSSCSRWIKVCSRESQASIIREESMNERKRARRGRRRMNYI